MPNSTRATLKRELERAVGNIQSAQAHILELIEAMAEHHPEDMDYGISLNMALDVIIDNINSWNDNI